jgi:hypothetical protein
MIRIEQTQIWITCESPLDLRDGRAIRGFFGNLYRNRSEFHGHRGDELVYKHPLIQYKVFGGSAVVVGLKEGAYLLKAVPSLEHLEIYHQKYPVLKQNNYSENVSFGLIDRMLYYSFATPWIGLNEDNYENYLSLKHNQNKICSLIERILTGNILSMSKSLGYVVEDKIQLKADLGETETVKIKDDVELIGFHGNFETNFMIPEFWGIGKFSSRGYGTVKRLNGGEKRNVI